jgi:hypothetical protein
MGGTSHIDSHMSYVIVFTCDTFLLLNAITGLPNLHIVSKCWLFMVPTLIRSKVCTSWTPVEKRMKHVDNSDIHGCNDAQGIFNIWLSTLTIHHITAQQNRWK